MYGCILYNTSELIADGIVLRLLVPSLRDIVGCVVSLIIGHIVMYVRDTRVLHRLLPLLGVVDNV